MPALSAYQLGLTPPGAAVTNTRGLLLRLIRAGQPITRTDIASRLDVDRSTVTENVKPLIDAGILREDTAGIKGQGRRPRVLSFVDTGYFIGVNLGVRRSQIGVTTLTGDIIEESDFDTPESATVALRHTRRCVEDVINRYSDQELLMIGVSVPGITDIYRSELLFAPNLDWRSVPIAELLAFDGVPVVVENDSTAAAMFEARSMIRDSNEGLMTNFILVRSGTGIGVGLVIGSEVYRGSGPIRGVAGEFGHMTIVAGGKSCVCGNRGCWEKYASAAAAASLYVGDRRLRPGETSPRFVEIVTKAENGDTRSRRTLEMIGDYLGIGVANVIMGIGIPRVIISGRLAYAWQYIEKPLRDAISRSIVGKADGWSVEPGSSAGAALGGALEVAVEEYLSTL